MTKKTPFSFRGASRVALGTFAIGLLGVSSASYADIYQSDTFKVYADFRLRFESDFDSQTGSGVGRSDRDRMRFRARIGVQHDPNANWSFGARLRSGSDDSHQSPHITFHDFDDNPTGDHDANFDKWYAKYKYNGFSAWLGRNSMPFWKQNEMYWDDDVTTAGLGLGYKRKLASGASFGVNGGYFALRARDIRPVPGGVAGLWQSSQGVTHRNRRVANRNTVS